MLKRSRSDWERSGRACSWESDLVTQEGGRTRKIPTHRRRFVQRNECGIHAGSRIGIVDIYDLVMLNICFRFWAEPTTEELSRGCSLLSRSCRAIPSNNHSLCVQLGIAISL